MLTLVAVGCFICGCAQEPARYDILINEIMANPSPDLGLRDAKYIELYNVSTHAYNLKGYTLSDGNNTAVIKIDFTLQPDSFVIISSGAGASALSLYGNAIGVTNFPTLHVTGDILTLRSKENKLLHAVAYTGSWYYNDVKRAGGWSLEMIDPANPCTGSNNWKASIDTRGGTPAQKNSVAATNKDETPPRLIRAYAPDSLHVTLVFDEPIDSSIAVVKENYSISDGIGIPSLVQPNAPLFNTITLVQDKILLKEKTYKVIIKPLSDCSGNYSANQNCKTGLYAVSNRNDIVINEILFDPPADGADYIELYNRSTHIINFKELYIANRNAAGNIGTLKQLSTEDILIFPGDYVVITKNAFDVKQHYLSKNPEGFLEIPSMPSLPNTNGSIVLLNSHGDIIDELSYDQNWHFPLITNAKGVALERIDPDKLTQDKSNWHSAAASVGYGTPSYQNSQFRADAGLQGEININPSVFSPDNDGYNDFLTITYKFPEQGYVCTISIFDAEGRPVRYVVRNGICGTDGYFRWDGLSEKNQQLKMGIYIVLTEVYNLRGTTKKFKQAVTLARSLR